MGHVIQMQSVSKVALSGVLAEKDMEAYSKALGVVKMLEGCTASARIRSLDHWLEAGLITALEHKETLDFYGYRRGQ